MADVPVSQPQPAEAPRARAFAGRPTIITGGAGVLGRVFADALAAEGAPIGIIDLDGERARALAEHLSSAHDVKARGVGADVLDREQLQAAADELAGAIGSARCLINAAGGNVAAATTLAEQIEDTTDLDSESFFGLSMSAFDQAIDLNLKGTVLPTQVFARSMIEAGDGAILNISSMNAYRPLTRIPAYAAGKSAVTNFTAWLAVHLAPRRVRVNAIAPGFFLTEQLRYLAYDEAGELTARYRRVLANTPMHRFGEPGELVGAVRFLLSDQASFITGVTLPIDGGFRCFAGV